MATLANANICGHTVCRGGTTEDNTSLGYLTLRSTNAANSRNTAFGCSALQNTGLSHCCNTAIGSLALCNNTTGQQNTAVGSYAGRAITSAYQEVAIGFRSLCSNSTGHKQVAIGACTNVASTTGTKSIAIGFLADTYNAACSIAIGAYAGAAGNRAVAIGNNAGAVDNNATAIGACSLAWTYSTSIGKGATTNAECSISIGYNTCSDFSNTIQIGCSVNNGYGDGTIAFGNSTNNVCNCIYTNWTYCSDINEKSNIQPLAYDFGLPLIKKLRPVKFNWDVREQYVEKCGFEFGQKDGTLAQEKEDYGLVAQELEQALNELNIRFDGLRKNDKRYHITETALLAPLVKSIQQLSAKLDSIKERITTLEIA